MKLVIQIPCLNEAGTLPATIADIPRIVDGFEVVEIIVVDDGSTDGTASVARSLGVDRVVRMNGNQGLARAFMAGLAAAVECGADVIVNTDADNQYQGSCIHRLVAPVVQGRADITIGSRPITTIAHFSLPKRLLQRFGSLVVRSISGADVLDAPSGFRAMTRDAALRLNVFNRFSYTIETTIQAGLSGLRIVSVPIEVNGPTRPSRLFKSTLGYVFRNVITILNVYMIYRPGRLFSMLASSLLVPGLALGARYLAFIQMGEGKGHVQSVIVAAALLLGGISLLVVGAIAHLQGINRRLLEEILYAERTSRQGLPAEVFGIGNVADVGQPVSLSN